MDIKTSVCPALTDWTIWYSGEMDIKTIACPALTGQSDLISDKTYVHILKDSLNLSSLNTSIRIIF